jgi:hypothetical protein
MSADPNAGAGTHDRLLSAREAEDRLRARSGDPVWMAGYREAQAQALREIARRMLDEYRPDPSAKPLDLLIKARAEIRDAIAAMRPQPKPEAPR